MICRSTEAGWFFITQPAHAWAAGQLAAAWDSSDLFLPAPKEEVILATTLHDVGWADWDKVPRLHSDGRPVNFIEITQEETAPIWERAVSHVSLYNYYSALLVSMHAATIYRQRIERGADPLEQKKMVESALDKQIETQQGIITQLGGHSEYGAAVEETQLLANYRILRICDLLLLALCTGLPAFAGREIPDVPGSDGQLTHTIHYELDDKEKKLFITPYPFSDKEFTLKIWGRRIDQKTFLNEKAYHDALQQADLEQIEFKLTRG